MGTGLALRLHAKTEFTPTCWNWTGATTDGGYGVIKITRSRRHVLVHRAAYGLEKIPAGYEIDHLCRNRRCVNPLHLEAVTPQENKFRTRKTHCKHGHAMIPENLYMHNGLRECKVCHRDRNRKYRLTIPHEGGPALP